MFTRRKAGERHHVRRHRHEVWDTFGPQDEAEPHVDGFGSLEHLYEKRYAPGAGVRLPSRNDREIITYVFEGALAQDYPTGLSGVLCTGEFQRVTTGRSVRCSETNASRIESTHLFQIVLCSSIPGLDPDHEQQRFSAAEREGGLCVIASPDGRKRSLRVHQDALVYSAILDGGQHLVHELLPGRIAWLHVVCGEATLGDVVITAGDGVGVAAEVAISFTALEGTEILLVDLDQRAELPPKVGAP
jgi:redox-sensitive bicupin YhaK (pirin superfamily)